MYSVISAQASPSSSLYPFLASKAPTLRTCAGDHYVQLLLKECLPLAEDTLECTIPRKMLGERLGDMFKWYRTVIDELQRISWEAWVFVTEHAMVPHAEITPEAEMKHQFRCPALKFDVRSCY